MAEKQNGLNSKVSQAVVYFWQTRRSQVEKQKQAGTPDQGYRGAVTGGAQMDGFISLITETIESAGIDKKHIYFRQFLELPGYFRPTKEWDLLVVKDNQLIIALEAKSQVGPSFGNNFNKEPKKQWEVPWIYGLPTERVPLTKRLNLG
jgi:hypothetical protein